MPCEHILALESYTMEKTRRSIRSLIDLAPKEALVRSSYWRMLADNA